MTNKEYTHLALIVDTSGSMRPLEADMNEGIKTLLDDQHAEPGRLTVDVTTFNTTVTQNYVDASASEITGDLIHASGGTALNDAVMTTINSLGARLAALPDEDRPGHVIVCIVTDGEENSSVEYKNPRGADAVKAAVKWQQEKYDWQFIFMGADSIDAFSAAAGMGISKGSTISYASTGVGTQAVYAAASAGISRSRGAAAGPVDFTDKERKAAKKK